MATLKLISDLSTSKSSMIKILLSFIFGDKDLNKYNGTKSYEKGDYIYDVSLTGMVSVYRCVTPTTGPYVSTCWENIVLGDMCSDFDEMVSLGTTMPTSENNQLWFMPVKSMEVVLPAPMTDLDDEIETMSMSLDAEAFPTVTSEAEVEEDDSNLILEEVGSSTDDTEVETEYDADVSSQSDVSVSDTTPTNSQNVWVDTDTSND